MEKAVGRILKALHAGEKVLVYGDYDVDGLTGTAVLLLFLRSLGMDTVYHVPDRLQEGYGFHRELLPTFRDQGVRLIVTVDCGISAVEAVQEANRLGLDVIVTDHHECNNQLPPALAVLNPKVPGNGFPFRDLAGVGVAFYLVIALRTRLRDEGVWQDLQEPNLLEYLDLVTLGTLADMVPLKQENRIFVKFGLREITKGRRPGIHILKQQAGIQGEIRQTRPLIFRIIPRINAPGRLGCSGVSLDILLSEKMDQALEISKVLEGRNRERKTIENQVHRHAREMARKQVEKERAVLVLAADGWHRGILGIVASRIAREFRRPAALVSFEGSVGKGSIRSIDGLEILDAVRKCNMFLQGYGGHRMAAGFSLKRDDLAGFQEAFEQAIRQRIQQEEEAPFELLLDSWVSDPGGLDDRFWDELERIGPFGYGNEEPVLGMRGVRILKQQIVGGNHLKLLLEFGSFRFSSIGFGMGQEATALEEGPDFWDVAFTPQQEIWKGRTTATLRIVEIQPA
jgi:single-stranded-DNA-specific exonuclease